MATILLPNRTLVFQVHTDTEAIEADYVISCIQANSLAQLLPVEYSSISDKLLSLPVVHVATAALEYPRLSPEQLPQVNRLCYC